MNEEKKDICKWSPDKDYPFFLYDPDGDGFVFFRTAEDRDEAAAACIPAYLDDYWSEEVENVFVGIATGMTQQINRQDRPEELDEEGVSWSHDHDYICDYAVVPLPPPQAISQDEVEAWIDGHSFYRVITADDVEPQRYGWVVEVGVLRALLRQLPGAPLDVDTLAQFIRQVDGDHTLGAGALAEKICERFQLQLPGAVPEGWKLVPVEPTEEMQVAGANAMRIDTTPICKLLNVPRIYKAMLNTSPASQPGQGKEEAWISVGERTPEKGALVLLAYRSKGKKSSIHMGRWSDAGWFFIHHDNMAKNIERVTHWMSLPASPAATDTGGNGHD